MSSIRQRNGQLFFDFRYCGVRCRELTTLTDTLANRHKMESVLKKIEFEISLGTFNYARYFPNSKTAMRITAKEMPAAVSPVISNSTPLFAEFAQQWKGEKRVEWRHSYIVTVDSILAGHLVPAFGSSPVGSIDRAAILSFRSKLGSIQVSDDGTESARSSATINRVMGILRQVMDEAAGRYGFSNPCLTVKRLKVKKVDIEPFSMDEVRRIIDTIRSDYKNYITVRFFTGMRSGEVHGLRWKHIDFERRQILIRETFTYGRMEYTKNDGSQRAIEMSQPVLEALKAHKPEIIDPEAYLFCNRVGHPVDNKNFDARVWQPLLRHMNLKPRRPYQMRHTCATLWLGAGENPEWIARQLGHTTTEMLFRVYSRYVPNLTRRDGSAFDRMVSAALNSGITDDKETTHV